MTNTTPGAQAPPGDDAIVVTIAPTHGAGTRGKSYVATA